MMASPPRTKEDYQIGIICALPVEKAAMVAMLDQHHPKLEKENGDDNNYTLGQIGVHKVVVACLPAGLTGTGQATIVANNMRRSFPIQFGLMVGIGGGVWSWKNDIRLGDVVVSQPSGTHGGVVQWDFGKTGKGGEFRRTGSLDKPPPILLHALQEMKAFDITDGVNIEGCVSLMIRNKPRMREVYRYPGVEHDQLFTAAYDHEGDETCESCDLESVVQRYARNTPTPKIHYGNIASGNEVVKHGVTRDKIAIEENVICFEMEAAGVMNCFPCLVIRGICDYADSHKNKIWQPYAAATAAAVARELFTFIEQLEVKTRNNATQVTTVSGAYNLESCFQNEPGCLKQTDIEVLLASRARQKGEKLDWQKSIVDLLKLLGLNSHIDSRIKLANILNIHVGPPYSAEQNLALHKAMMRELAMNGGTVPAEVATCIAA